MPAGGTRASRALAPSLGVLLAGVWLTLAGCGGSFAAPPAAAATAAGGDPVRISSEMRAERLAADTWVIVHERPWPANSLLVETADGTLVLCDTPYDDRATDDLLGWMSARFGKRSIIAVNGHFHADALGGNGALHAAGATTWGADLTARLLAERGPALRRQILALVPDDLVGRFTDARWEPPARTFPVADGLELDVGERVLVRHPGPAHSPDNVVTWFPDRGLLFGGCLVRASPRLPNVADADLERYPLAVERLRRLGARTIVPGHGPVGGPELLDVTLRAVEAHRSSGG